MAIVACPKCGAKNRVDESKADAVAVCGRCGAKLPAASTQPLELSDTTFDAAIAAADTTPILIDCWAPWCGPCRALGPVIDQLAAEASGRYTVAKLNTEIHQQVAARLRIDAIPCLLIYKNGKLFERLLGVQPKKVIEQHLERARH